MEEFVDAMDTMSETPTEMLSVMSSSVNFFYDGSNSDDEDGQEIIIGKVSSAEEVIESLENQNFYEKEVNFRELNAAERIKLLKEKADQLKQVLKEEWQMCKEESRIMDERIKEADRLQEMNDKMDRNIVLAMVQRVRLQDSEFSDKNYVNEIAHYRRPTKSSTSMSTLSESASKSTGMLDYEKRLAKKHESLSRSHVEQRFKVQQQIAADSYKQRLLEVEKLCAEELVKVKETHERLEPLNKIASDWSVNESWQKSEMSYRNSQLSHKADLEIRSRESKGVCSVQMAANIEIPLQTQLWYSDEPGSGLLPAYYEDELSDYSYVPTFNPIQPLVTSHSMFDSILETHH